MRIAGLLLLILTLLLPFGCSLSSKRTAKHPSNLPSLKSEAEILQAWQGDFPVAQLGRLPEGQRDLPVGFIDSDETFRNIWKIFKSSETIPDIDFKANLVLFARNTQFYNRIAIGKVKVRAGVAEVLAMETRSAMPIEDKVSISLVVIARKGISGIQTGDKTMPVPNG